MGGSHPTNCSLDLTSVIFQLGDDHPWILLVVLLPYFFHLAALLDTPNPSGESDMGTDGSPYHGYVV